MALTKVNVVIDETDDEILDELAKRDGRSRSSVVRQMIRREGKVAMVSSMPSPADHRAGRGSRS